MIKSVNPTTEEELETHDESSPSELEKVLNKLSNRASSTSNERAQELQDFAGILRANIDILAKKATLEMGKPIAEGRAEILKCAWLCDYYANLDRSLIEDKTIALGKAKSYISLQPNGITFAIMPWNFPYWQIFRVLAPNFLIGNSVLVKPAPNTMGCAKILKELSQSLPNLSLQFDLAIISAQHCEKIIADQRVTGVTLTGSTSAGRAVAEIAGRHLKKAVLELGGSDPYLILSDADIAQAAQECAASRLLNCGQSCIAAKRLIVSQDITPNFTEALRYEFEKYNIGNPLDETTKIGPIARLDLKEELTKTVSLAIQRGAKTIYSAEGLPKHGYFYAPTILSNVTPDSPAASKELFGPVACIIEAKNEEDAIAIANQSPYGLGAAVFSKNIERAEKIIRNHLNVGIGFVNEFVKSDPRLPFGGTKDSGYGRELGLEGLKEFANIKTIVVS